MFFKKKDDSDVDVLEKIKEKIAEDNDKKEQKLPGNDEAFLEDVLSEKDLDETNELSNKHNVKKEEKNDDSQSFNDINKIADETISQDKDEQEKFEDSIDDDDLLDELVDYDDNDDEEEEEEEDNDYDDDDMEDIETDDLNLPNSNKNNNLSAKTTENKSINSDKGLEKNNNVNTNNIQFNKTENNDIKKQSFTQDKTENRNGISFKNNNKNRAISISEKTKNNVRGHITELIEDVKNQMLVRSSSMTRQTIGGDKTITQLVTEIAQPIIVKYLDDNLERIVKDAINNEIKKIINDINNNN